MSRRELAAGDPAGKQGSMLYAAIYRVVARIPAGSVATYGQVATLAGYPGRARQVGYALAAMPQELELPWHRVINAKGRVSMRSELGWENYQRSLLDAEGILFDADERVTLNRFGWRPEDQNTIT